MTRREWSTAIVSLFREGDECIFPLIIRAIDKELASTSSEELLWREETLVVDLVGEFVRTTSAQPLARLPPSVREVAKEVKKKEDLADRWLVASAETMFNAVLDGIEGSPRLLKHVIKHLFGAAKERFPGFEFRAVGALVGLRCYCPAIVSPELYNLVKPGKEISTMARKALVRIARLLQHVFNETGMEEATSPEMTDEVLHWLKTIGMEQYQSNFECVEGAELLQVTEPVLMQMGITSLGHRKRLLRDIALPQLGGNSSAYCTSASSIIRSSLM